MKNKFKYSIKYYLLIALSIGILVLVYFVTNGVMKTEKHESVVLNNTYEMIDTLEKLTNDSGNDSKGDDLSNGENETDIDDSSIEENNKTKDDEKVNNSNKKKKNNKTKDKNKGKKKEKSKEDTKKENKVKDDQDGKEDEKAIIIYYDKELEKKAYIDSSQKRLVFIPSEGGYQFDDETIDEREVSYKEARIGGLQEDGTWGTPENGWYLHGKADAFKTEVSRWERNNCDKPLLYIILIAVYLLAYVFVTIRGWPRIIHELVLFFEALYFFLSYLEVFHDSRISLGIQILLYTTGLLFFASRITALVLSHRTYSSEENKDERELQNKYHKLQKAISDLANAREKGDGAGETYAEERVSELRREYEEYEEYLKNKEYNKE